MNLVAIHDESSGLRVAEPARQRAARIAGCTLLVYIAAGLTETLLFDATMGTGRVLTMLANAHEHASTLRWTVVLSLVTILSALTLGVALFRVTCDFGTTVALAGLVGRTAEGVIGAAYALTTAGLVAVAQSQGAGEAVAGSQAVAALLLAIRWDSALLSAVCFAVGSTAFAFLFVRGRAIPAPLAWLGLAASVLLVITLPVQIALGVRGILAIVPWLPMLVFEVALGAWFIVKGVRPVSVA